MDIFTPIGLVFLLGLGTAIATGLGVIPFFFKKNNSAHWLGISNAIAAGLMLTASFGMLSQGANFGIWKTVLGVLLGLVFIVGSNAFLSKYEHLKFGDITGLNAKKMFLMIGIMTVHSFAEGIAIGVSFGPSENFGILMSLVMALHNIPEGLAIALVLIPRGVSIGRASLWAIFSSLPQPLMAVPAFIFVLSFIQLLPIGLGFAAGAMIWITFSELLPDAISGTPKEIIATVATISIALMFVVQTLGS